MNMCLIPFKLIVKAGMVVNTYNPHTLEAEAEEWLVGS
jgi:hypothetical protein